jgi:hypothetical protein
MFYFFSLILYFSEPIPLTRSRWTTSIQFNLKIKISKESGQEFLNLNLYPKFNDNIKIYYAI